MLISLLNREPTTPKIWCKMIDRLVFRSKLRLCVCAMGGKQQIAIRLLHQMLGVSDPLRNNRLSTCDRLAQEQPPNSCDAAFLGRRLQPKPTSTMEKRPTACTPSDRAIRRAGATWHAITCHSITRQPNLRHTHTNHPNSMCGG
jgi:hypothetical protein